MQDSRVQISPDTWVYIDEDRAKIVVEIDLPREELDNRQPENRETVVEKKIAPWITGPGYDIL